MSSDNDPHNFEVKDKKAHNLPGEKLTPKTGTSGWDWWISFVFIPFYNIFFYHFLEIWDVRKSKV